MAIEIVEDLWTEIFKRLPIKSIGRFRSVCKAWNTLLSSALFFSIHHNFTVIAGQKSYLLMNKGGMLQQGTLYHPPEQQQQQHCGGGLGIGERVTYLDLPFTLNPNNNYFECLCFRVVDAVHGVICLSSGLDFVLWNPAIRKYIPGRYYCDAQGYVPDDVGFGFDAANNDLKVVKLSGEWWYDVLSVRDGFWRRVALPYTTYALHYYTTKTNSCFANGNIYWITHNKEGDTWALLLFDCEREEFNTLGLPQELTTPKDPEHELWHWLFKHGDNLAVMTSSRWSRTPKPLSFEVWVMEDEHSWKKLSKHSGSHIREMGNEEKMFKPCHRIELSSDDLPIRLGGLQQPLGSGVYRESLFLMDINAPNLPTTNLTPLSCQHCYHRTRFYSGNASTLQSKLL